MNFGIFGSCVTRDIFTINEEASTKWKVTTYLSRTTCASALSSRILIDDVSATNFDERRFRHDLEKKHFEIIEKDISDFFIIDLIDERHSIYQINDKKITYTKSSSPYILEYMKKHGGEVIHPGSSQWNVDEQIKNIKSFFIKAVSIKNKIYLHEALWANSYIDKENNKKAFDSVTLAKVDFWNEFLEKTYKSLVELDGIVPISAPSEFIISDEKHMWGLAPFHYHDNYYNELQKIIKMKIKEQ